jgi:hypothetical protein
MTQKIWQILTGLNKRKNRIFTKKPTVRCFPLSDKKVLRLRIQIWPSYDNNSKIANQGRNLHTEVKLAISELLSAQHCTRDCCILYPRLSFFTRDFCSCFSSILYPRFLYLYHLNPVPAISVLVSAQPCIRDFCTCHSMMNPQFRDFCTWIGLIWCPLFLFLSCISSILYLRSLYLSQLNPLPAICVLISA